MSNNDDKESKRVFSKLYAAYLDEGKRKEMIQKNPKIAVYFDKLFAWVESTQQGKGGMQKMK